jgi:hypothetical protein
MLHLATLAQGHWLTVSLIPGKPFLGLVPSLEGLFQSLLWPHEVVWPGLNIQVSRCHRILLLPRILGPPYGLQLSDGAGNLLHLQTQSTLSLQDDESKVSDLLLANLDLFSGDFAACLRESG